MYQPPPSKLTGINTTHLTNVSDMLLLLCPVITQLFHPSLLLPLPQAHASSPAKEHWRKEKKLSSMICPFLFASPK